MKQDVIKKRVLMVGVGPNRVGGMWAVAEEYIKSPQYNKSVDLVYVATSTNGNLVKRSLYMLLGYLKIIWTLNTKPIDIVHIHMAEKGSTFRKGLVAKWAKGKNKKVIIHLHAGPFMAWYKSVSKKTQDKIKKILHYSDSLLVLGSYWLNELSEIVPIDKMTVLYNGVPCPDSNPYSNEARNIVFFGVMRKEKGIYDLINAVKCINNELPSDIKVVLCGNDLEGNIAETIENAGLSPRFDLVGWVTGNKKELIYQNAMMDILPSYFEGLSMTVLEAMARGIPVITTNISTMPELIGKNGILIEPGDVKNLAKAILLLSSDREKRHQMSQEEYERIKCSFSDSVFIEKTLNIYKQLSS